MNDDITVDCPPSRLLDPIDNFRQQPRAIQSAPLGIRIREELADVAESGRSHERIGHGVANHVRIGVTEESERMIDRDSTEN
jgi:hypothetical protein